MDLFDHARKDQIQQEAPLAARMRPRSLDEFVGQEHIVGPGRLLRRAIQADQLSSVIFYGPPGTGKTTLAAVIANTTRSHFETLNAVLAGVADIRRVIKEAQERRGAAITGGPSSLWTKCIAGTRPSRTRCCPGWKMAPSSLSAPPPRTPTFSVNRPLVEPQPHLSVSSLTEDDLRRPSPALPCAIPSVAMVS